MKKILLILKEVIYSFCRRNKLNILLSIGILAFIMLVWFVVGIAIKQDQNIYGNLRNMGFSVSKGKNIYCLELDNQNIKGILKIKDNKKEKISDNGGLFLNIDGNRIYYLDETSKSIISVKTNGEDKKTLIENIDLKQFTVRNGWIYYFENSNFYKIKTNGKNKTKLSEEDIINYQIEDNIIYYSYEKEEKIIIAKMKTNGKNVKIIDEEAGTQFFLVGNEIYYIKENYNYENYEYNYELYKTNGKNKEYITKIEGQINTDTINADKSNLYYAKENKDKKLSIYKIKFNGKNETKIVDLQSYSTLINVHDSNLYYTDINEKGKIQLFKVKVNGEDKNHI